MKTLYAGISGNEHWTYTKRGNGINVEELCVHNLSNSVDACIVLA